MGSYFGNRLYPIDTSVFQTSNVRIGLIIQINKFIVQIGVLVNGIIVYNVQFLDHCITFNIRLRLSPEIRKVNITYLPLIRIC